MLGRFYPHEYAEDVFALDYGKIYRKGFRAIIFDIDMTLVPHGEDSTPKIDALFKKIHAIGLKTLLLTNNDEPRVKCFIKNINTPYICNAAKPAPDAYLRAIDVLGVQKDETLFVGDQIFTDILGANKAGIANILVKYVTAHEETDIGIRRRLEKIILKFYSLSSYRHRLGDIFRRRRPKCFGTDENLFAKSARRVMHSLCKRKFSKDI